jgi:chaperonin cofactor prefoldin
MADDSLKREDMASQLVKQADVLRNELMELEKQFNIKKEQFLKIQGALEALNALGTEIPVPPSEEAKD